MAGIVDTDREWGLPFFRVTIQVLTDDADKHLLFAELWQEIEQKPVQDKFPNQLRSVSFASGNEFDLYCYGFFSARVERFARQNPTIITAVAEMISDSEYEKQRLEHLSVND